jgi:electron transport complex protein RnfG
VKSKKPDFKELGVISTLMLFSITVIITALLAGVNQFTKAVISEHQIEEAEISHKIVFGSADSFTDRSEEFIGEDDAQIITVFDARDTNGDVIGVVLETTAKGYNGDVKVMTGIGPDMEITGLAVTSNNETPGLGTKVLLDDFTEQFIGGAQGVRFTLKAEETELELIDGVTGATLSSRAVVNAVNRALDFAGEIMDEITSGGSTDE